MQSCDFRSFLIFTGAAAGCMAAGSFAHASLNDSKVSDFWKVPIKTRFFMAFTTSVTLAHFAFGIAKELSPVTGMTDTLQKVVAFITCVGLMSALSSEAKIVKGEHRAAVGGVGALGGIAGFVLTCYLVNKIPD